MGNRWSEHGVAPNSMRFGALQNWFDPYDRQIEPDDTPPSGQYLLQSRV
jgi:hypothetical protein